MKLDILEGTTSRIIDVFIQDSSSAVGAGLTGLVFNSGSLTAFYYLNDAPTGATAITLVTMTIGTFASSGFIEVDAADMPGVYSLGVPNAALTGADSVIIYLKGATNMAPVVLEIQLTNYDPYDVVRMVMTALPNVAAGSAGGVATDTDSNGAVRIVDGTGAREINTNVGAVALVDLVTTTTTVTDDVGITSTAVNLIWDEAMTETTGAPAITASFREALKWMFALSRNKILQTATLTTLRNDADGGDLATSAVSDDATTYTRDEWST